MDYKTIVNTIKSCYLNMNIHVNSTNEQHLSVRRS